MFTGKNYTGNGRFSGFCVDLLESISRIVGFDYIIELVPDNKYGALDPATGEWNGIVAQLIKHVRVGFFVLHPVDFDGFLDFLSHHPVLDLDGISVAPFLCGFES